MMPKKLKQVNQAYDVDEQFVLTVYTIKGGGGEELNQYLVMTGRTNLPLPPFCCSVFLFEPFRVSGLLLTMAALVSVGIGMWLGYDEL
ncbi:hypothetical protein Hanom_Chr06g00509621 [Helianthus anomalus]